MRFFLLCNPRFEKKTALVWRKLSSSNQICNLIFILHLVFIDNCNIATLAWFHSMHISNTRKLSTESVCLCTKNGMRVKYKQTNECKMYLFGCGLRLKWQRWLSDQTQISRRLLLIFYVNIDYDNLHIFFPSNQPIEIPN